MHDYDELIDATGLKCPQPLLLVKQAIKQCQVGQVICVQATDPHTDLDIEVWCDRFGHDILHVEIDEVLLQFWIKKGPA